MEVSKKPMLLEVILRRRHYSFRTEKSYIHWISRFVRFHGRRHPRDLGKVHIAAFLTHLAVERKVSASTQNQALNALVFLYRQVLGLGMPQLHTVTRAKKPRTLPTVLSPDDVRRLLSRLDGKYSIAGNLLYGSGLRLIECLRLRVQDIDLAMRRVIVRAGKGDKDRVTVLPDTLVGPLTDHLERLRAAHRANLEKGLGAVYLPAALARIYPKAPREWGWQFVFPSRTYVRDRDTGTMVKHHLHEKALQRAIPRAALDSDVTSRATAHTLRHSFATHLLQRGADIRTIGRYRSCSVTRT